MLLMVASIAVVIKKRRVELGMTQEELAEAIGIHKRQITRYESGAIEPALDTARKLSEVLRLTLSQLDGAVPYATSLTGTWWFAIKRDQEVQVAEIEIIQREASVRLISKAALVGEANFHGANVFTGWYQPNHESPLIAILLEIESEGSQAKGQWISGQVAGQTRGANGLCAMAKTNTEALQLLPGGSVS